MLFSSLSQAQLLAHALYLLSVPSSVLQVLAATNIGET